MLLRISVAYLFMTYLPWMIAGILARVARCQPPRQCIMSVHRAKAP
ncbi:MAG: hypothetical protein OJF49_001322 [Ktedonobacterales bacterium]|nr:MAG: hypothetical protein OJF49_001322 [Ktedonobacterales bacterium]